ncbi:MAG: recombination protein RecR [Elusimicrobia bacterium]|nr:recombination protein RecR [Elusimicrobiota bacterium]
MKPFEKLVASLRRLPGIGPKQAERLALHLLRASSTEVEQFQLSLREVRERVRPCPVCLDYTDQPTCRICADPAREERVVCVVEDPTDVAAVERTRRFRGRYHVLHGVLSPLDGVGPENLRIRELLARVGAWGEAGGEVILATNHDTEGDATALYLGRLLQPLGVRVTRIAIGVPLGGDLAYIDEQTLSEALAGRRSV